eukprot:GHVU01029863.1.p1 GENE.GHVU01029863.1~~GHVU01029863.1.p1  ORF type:complete len:198 (-),score=14.90 GHVU01029863.1:776-1369(-)
MVHDDVMATTHSHLSAAHPSFPLMSPESLRCIRSLVVDPNTNAPSRDWYEACLQGGKKTDAEREKHDKAKKQKGGDALKPKNPSEAQSRSRTSADTDKVSVIIEYADRVATRGSLRRPLSRRHHTNKCIRNFLALQALSHRCGTSHNGTLKDGEMGGSASVLSNWKTAWSLLRPVDLSSTGEASTPIGGDPGPGHQE